jgi:DNA-directed RNA polymerase sigma subunit (sigma70/sigma32)
MASIRNIKKSNKYQTVDYSEFSHEEYQNLLHSGSKVEPRKKAADKFDETRGFKFISYATDRKVDHESMCSDLMQVLCSVLNDRERTIVIQSFGIRCQERALDDIGYDIGLTRERVRQIRERGLDKMRKSSKSRFLLRHLG